MSDNPKLLTREELAAIAARAKTATPGPWFWSGNIKAKQFHLIAKTSLYPIVMGFVRWGNLWGIPQFRNAKRDVMVEAYDLINKPDHNNKFEGINHPDAEFIAHSREDIDRLLAHIEALEAEQRKFVERASQHWEQERLEANKVIYAAAKRIEALELALEQRWNQWQTAEGRAEAADKRIEALEAEQMEAAK